MKKFLISVVDHDGIKKPWGWGMGCACCPGHALQCLQSCAGQWSVQWGVWRGSWCALGLCPLPTALHPGAGGTFAWFPQCGSTVGASLSKGPGVHCGHPGVSLKLKAWKAGIESKGLHVNMKKFLVSGVGHDVLKKSGKNPCGVCSSGASNNSIQCSQCTLWVL